LEGCSKGEYKATIDEHGSWGEKGGSRALGV
jgi:hypothetical protein